jgi:predicted nucleic acid-binding protein
MVLECAVTAGADCIVTDDAHLLELKKFETIRIVTPAQFLGD